MRGMLRVVIVLGVVLGLGVLLVGCVVGGGLYLWATSDTDADLNPITAIRLKVRLARYNDTLTTPAGTDESFREFVVSPGDTPDSVATALLMQGLITDPNLFVDYAQYHGLDSHLQAGTYFLRQTQTMEEIAYALTDASAAAIPFRTIAGWRLEELAENVIDTNPLLGFSGADFLAVTGRGAPLTTAYTAEFAARVGIPAQLIDGNPPSLEGFMFPGDYRLNPAITPEGLRDRLLEAFDANVTPPMYTRADELGLTMYEVITLASIVQREAVKIEEGSLIASVYLNRLNRNMRLDADPTVQYAIGFRDGRWWPNLTGESDYYALSGPQQDYAYNTYLKQDGALRVELMPPGPVASPGLAAINAVLYPAQTDYLYFRSCDDQTHIFSTNLADHANITCP